ncbi:MAG TPA: hypothetical protein VJN02_04345 [Gammaproteobacteria bacterium]|nr:hypothetical protein [Gammaproteobacteria bacterium]
MTKTGSKQDGYESDTEFPYTISVNPKKKNVGGMSIENQGRPMRKQTRAYSLNADTPSLKKPVAWSYTVAVTKSIYDTRGNQQTIDDYLTIAPTNNSNRLSLLMGINEQIKLSDSSDSDLGPIVRTKRRQRKKKNGEQAVTKLDTHTLPVHIQFSFWQANWISRNTEDPATIDQVRCLGKHCLYNIC